MSKEYWQSRWDEADIGFHRSSPHPLLTKYVDKFSDHKRVYLPFCGKSVDMLFLKERGHQVVGTEVIKQPIVQFFSEQALELHLSQTKAYDVYTDHVDQNRAWYTILKGDAFTLQKDDLGGYVDAIYDRAALVAVDPPMRNAYVQALARILKPGGMVLAVVFEYDQSKVEGPPWSILEEDLMDLFSEFAEIKKLDTYTEKAGKKFQAAGIPSLCEQAYLIVK